MSKIQELLAAQRSKANGSTNQTPAIVQQTSANSTSSTANGTGGSIFEKPLTLAEKLARAKGNSGRLIGHQAVEQGRTQENVPNVVEQSGPLEKYIPNTEENLEARFEAAKATILVQPEGLTGIALMRWQKANPNYVANKPSSTTGNSLETVGAKESVSGLPQNQDKQLSASQTSDAQKTNDGQIQVEELRNNLKYLADNIENKDLVPNIIRTIGLQLKNSPEITPYMTHADVNLVVRGARSAYQLAAMAKQNKEDGKKGKSKVMAEVDQIFKDGGIDFSTLNFKL